MKLALVAYFAIALTSAITDFGPRQLFTGRWFTKTPIIFNDYGLFVTSIQGKKLDTPAYYEWIPKLTSKVWFFQIYGQIQKLGKTLNTADQTEQINQLYILQAQLPKLGVEFELHRRKYDSLEYIQEKTIQSYEKILLPEQ